MDLKSENSDSDSEDDCLCYPKGSRRIVACGVCCSLKGFERTGMELISAKCEKHSKKKVYFCGLYIYICDSCKLLGWYSDTCDNINNMHTKESLKPFYQQKIKCFF
jgi:hypothetical protein